MSNGKKIKLTMKPMSRAIENKIDEWVTGNNINTKNVNSNFKRTTIYLPEEVHKNLKMAAAKRDMSMSELIIECLVKELR